jgi:hypothetical protein
MSPFVVIGGPGGVQETVPGERICQNTETRLKSQISGVTSLIDSQERIPRFELLHTLIISDLSCFVTHHFRFE